MVRRRPALSILAVIGAIALAAPPAARTQPAQAAQPDDDDPAIEALQSTAWPQPAAGASASGDPELLFSFDDGPASVTL